MSVGTPRRAIAAAALSAAAALTNVAVPTASAAPRCNDIELVFARGLPGSVRSARHWSTRCARW